MREQRINWRFILTWMQPIILAALTGGIFFVRGEGQRAVETESVEWQAVYTRSIKQFMETEIELERVEEELRQCEAQSR